MPAFVWSETLSSYYIYCILGTYKVDFYLVFMCIALHVGLCVCETDKQGINYCPAGHQAPANAINAITAPSARPQT